MGEVDKRGKLNEAPFSFQITKAGKMRIYYQNRQVMILKEKNACRLLVKLKDKSTIEQQLVLAKVTGNFKRGNERDRKQPSIE